MKVGNLVTVDAVSYGYLPLVREPMPKGPYNETARLLKDDFAVVLGVSETHVKLHTKVGTLWASRVWIRYLKVKA